MSPQPNKKREWENDLVRRQRNIVFPDTVENEGRFWRGILRGEIRLNAIQKVGTAVVLLAVLGIWGLTVLRMVTGQESGRPLWAKVLNVAVPLGLAVGLLLGFMAFIGWQIKREQRHRSNRHDPHAR